MTVPLDSALEQAGGVSARRDSAARLRQLLEEELARGAGELDLRRSGYGNPVTVAIGPAAGALRAVVPADPGLRADPARASPRTWSLIGGVCVGLAGATELPPARGESDLVLRAGSLGGRLCLELPATGDESFRTEIAATDATEALAGIDRLRARALAVPGFLVETAGDLRPPVGLHHPLLAVEALARVGADPNDPSAEDEDAVLAVLDPPGQVAGPHEDPDPDMRIARRILRRLDGMGKWGGYHTEFVHLGRGFATHERHRVAEVGEALLAAGLLLEKQSTGQRHVWLNPGRSGEIRRLIEEGAPPPDLEARIPGRR